MSAREVTCMPGVTVVFRIFQAAAGLWFEDQGARAEIFAEPVPARAVAVRTRGAVRGKGGRNSLGPLLASGQLDGVHLEWEIRQSGDRMELLLSAAPALDEIHSGESAGGKVTQRRGSSANVARKILEAGDNDLPVLLTDGERLMIRAVVQKLRIPGLGGGSPAAPATNVLDEARQAVEQYLKDYSPRKKKDEKEAGKYVLPAHGLLSLAELDEPIGEAIRIGRDLHPDASVLILGETGTGKELIADLVYREMLGELSRRYPGQSFDEDLVPRVKAVCSLDKGGDQNILLGWLFGQRPGFIHSADQGQEGLFLKASGYEWVKGKNGWAPKQTKTAGLLFLDEIGLLHGDTRATMLRALDNHEIEPRGWSGTVKVSAKLVFATEADISGDSGMEESFRQRIGANIIRVPPLRERRGIIPHLVHYFTDRFFSERMQGKAHNFRWHEEALIALTAYLWPGNIRELKNVVYNTLGRIMKKHSLREGETGKIRIPSGTVRLKHINKEIAEYFDIVRGDHAEATSRLDGSDIAVARKITDIASELFEKAFSQPLAPAPEGGWKLLIEASLKCLESWLKLKHPGGLRGKQTGCNGLLSGWLGPEKTRRILIEAVSHLGRPSSNDAERRAGVGSYYIFGKFFGVTYRTYTGWLKSAR